MLRSAPHNPSPLQQGHEAGSAGQALATQQAARHAHVQSDVQNQACIGPQWSELLCTC